MRAHMPRRGKTLADKMFIDRACSEISIHALRMERDGKKDAAL